ncbi:hypothetical protein BMS3Abin09_01192 [bacterium BMS3Abin09]|nr:hypothetical protein BMS3Abin09_01192 [bacterium BMS3Abin09]
MTIIGLITSVVPDPDRIAVLSFVTREDNGPVPCGRDRCSGRCSIVDAEVRAFDPEYRVITTFRKVRTYIFEFEGRPEKCLPEGPAACVIVSRVSVCLKPVRIVCLAVINEFDCEYFPEAVECFACPQLFNQYLQCITVPDVGREINVPRVDV